MPDVLLALDELMFAPQGWFALGAANERVAGVVVTSLRDGLRLVGQEPVRAVVGRLRPQVRVVDVDAAGPVGEAAVELLAAWCREQGLWHLVRPSGGGPGRAHVFVAAAPPSEGRTGPVRTPAALKQLAERVEEVRGQLGAGRRGLEVRDTVRPLSSPHRHGVKTRPLGSASVALTDLTRLLGVSGPRRVARSGRSGRVTARAAVPQRRRARRDLPPAWAAYVSDAVLPSVQVDTPGTHSNYEAVATAVLLRCGHDAESAWTVIDSAHEQAFTKARRQGRAWWVKYVWNAAVAADDAFVPTATEVDLELLRDLEGARSELEALAWRQPVRRRPALLLVGHAVLDRMRRTGVRRVPVPERDLVVDTGLSDRKTIRAQLRLLAGAVGVLHTDAWDPVTQRDSSSFEFELLMAQGVSNIPPPSFHPPIPAGLWTLLPRPAHQVWRALLAAGRPLSAAELCAVAALTESPTSAATRAQVRSLAGVLRALGTAGLAVCGPDGTWSPSASVAGTFREVAQATTVERQVLVEAERQAYRAGFGSSWDVQRAAAHKAQRAKEVAWWRQLDPTTRVMRRDASAARFAALSAERQEQLKAALADRRRLRGDDEVMRYRMWLDSLSDDELATRSLTRAQRFHTLPQPLQQALVMAWQRHRDRYELPYRAIAVPRLEQHELLPVGAQSRDEHFWRQESLDTAMSPTSFGTA